MTNQVTFLKQKKTDNGIRLVPVEFSDRWASNHPELREEVTREIEGVLIPAINDYINGRGGAYKRGEANHISDKFFARSEVIDKWRKTMPTAAALYPLQKPERKQLADGTPFDEVAERYFPHALDGEGLRSRAAIMSHLMYDKFKDTEDGKTLQWASLASGAAVPVFDAASRLLSQGKRIELYLADIDRNALRFAKKLANAEYGIDPKVLETDKRNILKLDRLVGKLGKSSYEAIDILGFFEYLPADPWQYKKYKVTTTMPGAIQFLEAAYSLLRPGGLLVLGNMRNSHKQLKFATHVVQWPYIRPRDLDRVTDIITSAGVSKDKIAYYQAGDGVYTVAAITK